MGQKYEFWCKACGYEAKVSGGGDAGMMICTQTVACAQCRRLYDVVTSRIDRSGEWGGFEGVDPRCPRRKTHSIQEWEYPGPCPECGEGMYQGELGMLWD